VTVKQQSSSTPSLSPLFPSPSLGLQTLPHVFVLLSCWSGCGGGVGGFKGKLLCWTPANGLWFSRTSLSQKCRFSGQIKYLIYNLYIFFSVSLFLWRSLHLCCPLQVGSGTCLLGVHQVIMWLYGSYTRSVKRRTEQSGEQGTENEKRVTSLLAAVTYSLRSWVGSALIIPHINNPNSDWLSITPSGSNVALYWLAWWPCARWPPPAAGERGEGRARRSAEMPLLHTLTTLYNSRSKQSRAPFLYCMLGRG